MLRDEKRGEVLVNYDTDIPINIIDDVLDLCDFEDNDDRIICEDIVNELESLVASSLKEGKIVSLPYCGILHRNEMVAEFKKRRNDFKKLRKEVGKTEYKDAARIVFNQIQKDIDDRYEEKQKFNFVKKQKKDEFKRNAKLYGIKEATRRLQYNSKFKVVPFNEELENIIQKLYESKS